MSKKKPREPATDDELKACKALNYCTFQPGSWDKRFVRNLFQEMWHEPTRAKQDATITDGQREWLWRLVWKYRRQIRDKTLVDIGEEWHTGQ